MNLETNELPALENKLEEEIDTVSTQKQELEAKADRLKAEKASMKLSGSSWMTKRNSLYKKKSVLLTKRNSLKFLKDERESLKAANYAMRDQCKHDLESFSKDRETFTSELERVWIELFSKIQKERIDLLLYLEMQKKDLENHDIDMYLAYQKHLEKQYEKEKAKKIEPPNDDLRVAAQIYYSPSYSQKTIRLLRKQLLMTLKLMRMRMVEAMKRKQTEKLSLEFFYFDA